MMHISLETMRESSYHISSSTSCWIWLSSGSLLKKYGVDASQKSRTDEYDRTCIGWWKSPLFGNLHLHKFQVLPAREHDLQSTRFYTTKLVLGKHVLLCWKDFSGKTSPGAQYIRFSYPAWNDCVMLVFSKYWLNSSDPSNFAVSSLKVEKSALV